MKPFFFKLFAIILFFSSEIVFAYDGDMDIYREFKEDLALVRDSYVSTLNMAMETSTENDPEGFLKARAKGEYSSWKSLEYEEPETSFTKISEIPYGFQLKGNHGAYAIDVKIKVVTRDSDIFYDIQYQKTTNAPGKEILQEVFRNDRVIFFDENSPCTRKAVTCINEYSKGTTGILK